ncbi:MAG: sn-glycerol-1-phosphate dehydrogenase [Firmicutes bacterium]|nr:sn-glycerol-1-phosphate dehydrogenase [Bacillota bacterium]
MAALDEQLAPLRKGYVCGCGRRHQLSILDIEVDTNLLARIPEKLQKLGLEGPAHLVADTNTMLAAGGAVESALEKAGMVTSKTIYATPDRNLVPDERSIARLFLEVPVTTEVLLAVGSGTITDLVRFTAYKLGKPFVSVPTAPSMDGYASAVAPLIVGGFKRTYPAKPALAIYADLDVLCEAPSHMIVAGFGDLLGKFTARADWQLSRILHGEYYCQSSSDLITTALEKCSADPEGLYKRKPLLIQGLIEGLILSGIAIDMAGNSRPASGAEHMLAHYWEMRSLQEQSHYHLHGTKVGVATPLILGIYNKLFHMDPGKIDLAGLARCHHTPQETERSIRNHFGPMAEEILGESPNKRLTWEARENRVRLIQAKWDEILSALAWLPEPEAITEMLRKAHADSTPAELGLPQKWIDDALTYARHLRARYSILDVAAELGVL